MRSRESVMEVVDFVLAGNNITESATAFNCSRKTINNILDMVRNEDGPYYNEILKKRIYLTLEKLTLEARKRAGSKSRRNLVISDEEAWQMIEKIIYEGATLRDLAAEKGCSHTSVANAIARVSNDETLKAIEKARMCIPMTTSENEHYKKALDILESLRESMNPDIYDEIKTLYEKPRGR